MRAAGLGDLLAPPPALSADAAAVMHAWRFLGGWHAQALPLYAALYPVADLHLLVDGLQAVDRLLAAEAA